jgi:DNA-binding NtrC family response regulator
MPTREIETASEVDSTGTGRLSRLLPHLFVVLSCDKPLDGGARHALDHLDELTMGRGATRAATRRTEKGVAHLTLTVPGKQLSGTHARMIRAGAGWTIEDCHSTNGVHVNGARVERAVLADGDVIELGRTIFLYRAVLATPPDTPHDLDTRDVATAHSAMATLLPTVAHDLVALAKVARSALPLLLIGETGTGKEVLAQAVHALSRRAGPLVPVNCGAIPETLLEGQLFGHVRGAFSGAVRDELGLVRAADGGTLFLDEIGDLPETSQAALLRVLQEGEVQPIGATRPIKVEIRALAATHRPLGKLAMAGRFRSDLYARLNGYTHEVPPLRARVEDLPLLLSAILPKVVPNGAEGTTIAPAVVRAFLRYRWPLNIRELTQTLARAAVLAQGARLDLGHLPPEIAAAAKAPALDTSPASEDDGAAAGHEPSSDAIRDALARHKGNQSKAYAELGLPSRFALYRLMRKHGILARDDDRKR